MSNALIVFCYTIAAYGLTNLLVYGSGPFDILIKFREYSGKLLKTLGDMLECMMCTSTNVGWIISLLNLIFLPNIGITPFNIIFDVNMSLWYFIIPLDACITSGFVWLLHTLQECLESITNKNSSNGREVLYD